MGAPPGRAAKGTDMLGSGGNGRDVVSMTDREKARRLAPIRTVEAYWRGLCGPDQIPLRSQVDPRGMETALENAFLAERIAPSLAKLRVAGTHLSDLMGMEVSGMPLSTMIAPSDRDRLGQAVARLFTDPAIVRIGLRAEGGFGRPDLTAQLIILPLRSDLGDITRALGAMVSTGQVGRTPRRFTITSVDIEPAFDHGLVTPVAGNADPLGMAETQRPFKTKPGGRVEGTPAPRSSQGAPYLRLVVSNDD